MRPAVERHPGAHRRRFGRRQQQAIGAEIVEPDPVPPNGIEHLTKATMCQ
jgi:hypothetical protein